MHNDNKMTQNADQDNCRVSCI